MEIAKRECQRYEAEALLWAVEIAKRECQSHVIFEGDVECCFDPLTDKNIALDWSISAAISNILSYSKFFMLFLLYGLGELATLQHMLPDLLQFQICLVFFQ